MCKCRVCLYHRQFRQELAKLPEADRPFSEDMMSRLNAAESDVEYYEAIVEGRWVGSDEIIARYRSQSATS